MSTELTDEEQGSMLCPQCGGHEAHKEGCRSETPTPQTELKPGRQAGSVDFVRALKLREEQHPANEIQRRRVVVEDEWQTTEDCLDDSLFADASFYLSRMISEAKRLLRVIDGIGANVTCPQSESNTSAVSVSKEKENV